MSNFIQQSFLGGMNLLADDVRLQPDQYRIGFNVRNRYDVLEATLKSELDIATPEGVKQELITFGNYLVLFVDGKAYYRYYTATGWQQIIGFQMDVSAPRYWTQEVPVALTNYLRYGIANASTMPDGAVISNAGIHINELAGAFAGNTPGLVVQDNINQPRFIFLDANGVPTVRVLQTYAQWTFTISGGAVTVDEREYVPIGNTMAWVDGILYIAAQDGVTIFRSVSGRPLDFVIAVDDNGDKVGDAFAASYSVGVGGITCLREMSNNSLFVAANNSNFLVSKNMTQNAPTIYGEYTFIRTFLFNATCLSGRVILDSIGDTRFIDLTGVRSFNAIRQVQNEGKNSPFTANIQAAFGTTKDPVIQNSNVAAAILYDNYEFYALKTIFGPAIAVFDTLSNCWASFDVAQVGGKNIKILAKIELTIQRLYAVTEDDKLYTLYIGPDTDSPLVRPISISPNVVQTEQGYGVTPKGEIKLQEFRCVFNKIVDDMTVSVKPYVNNRVADDLQTKIIQFIPE